MTFDTRSFFIGIATVLGILVVGFGGGVMMGNVISGDPKVPNKLERQATTEPIPAEAREPKFASAPVSVTNNAQAMPPSAGVHESTPAEAAPPVPVPEPVLAATPPRPEPQPQNAAQSPAQPEVNQTPDIRQEKPVSLVQPADQLRPKLSHREEARLRAQQRHEERARRREERRMRIAERRQQEQVRREEIRSALERARSQEVDDDDDDDDRPVVVRRGRPFELPFFRIFR